MKFETDHAHLYVHDVLYAPKMRVNLASFDRSTTDGWKWEFEDGVGSLTYKGGLYATASRDPNFGMLYRLEEVNISQIHVVSSKQDDDVLKFFVHVAKKKLT